MRGFWYIIESVLAGIVIFSFLAIMGRTYMAVPGSDLSAMGFESLKSLDDQGLLKNYTVSGDYDAINSLIDMGTYNHSVRTCDYSGSCSGPTPNATNVWTAVYIMAGNESYAPHEVRLFIW